MPSKILLLGGTREAVELAEYLSGMTDCDVTTSLAGRTSAPLLPAGKVRTGGYGGVDGLARYLVENRIDLLVDATHPYAQQISANALSACERTGINCLRYLRPPWEPAAGDNWLAARNLSEAADLLSPGATAFLALGSQYLSAFAGRTDVTFIARMIETIELPKASENWRILQSKPSHDAVDESELFRREAITHLVCRNSGGKGAAAKLVAARKLQLPVIMLERPQPPAGKVFSKLDTLLAAIKSS